MRCPAPTAPRYNPASTGWTRTTRRWPRPANSQPTRWRRSPNPRLKDSDVPDHSVSRIDRARRAGRDVGGRAARRCGAVVGRLADRDVAVGIRAAAGHRDRGVDAGLVQRARALAGAEAAAKGPAR